MQKQIKKGLEMVVFDCKLENPPQEIAEQGRKAILKYWKENN
jgi:hypothetical protein